MTSHIWDILSRNDSLWVRWVYTHRVRDENFWLIRNDPAWPWVFRRLLDIRDQVRPFFMMNIGNGRQTNAWSDKWLPVGRLPELISFRLFSAEGFSRASSARDVLLDLSGAWPSSWVDTNARFAECTLPLLHESEEDMVCWLDADNSLVPFSVRQGMKTLEASLEPVAWHKDVWFSMHIPKHAFCLWLACKGRLPTQDRLSWKDEPPDPLLCPLCRLCMDSHAHLFFRCPYALDVWNWLKMEAGMTRYPDDWDGILVFISDGSVRRSKLHRLTLAAAVYFVWQERNRRLFSSVRRSGKELVRAVRDVVLKRMARKAVHIVDANSDGSA